MKRIGKSVFFIIFFLILFITYTSVFGIYGENGDYKLTYLKGMQDIRWGIDIKGGVEAVFAPAEGVDATDEQMNAVKSIIDLRLVNQNVTDYEIYPDFSNDRITVRFPWKSDDTEYDPGEAIKELSSTAQLVFRGGTSQDGEEILTGKDVKNAYVSNIQGSDGTYQKVVSLEFSDEGKEKFAEATEKYLNQQIGIWMTPVYPLLQYKVLFRTETAT